MTPICSNLLHACSFSGNSDLHIVNNGISHTILIICVVIGAIVLLGAAFGCYFFTCRRKKKPHEGTHSSAQLTHLILC
jgi:hypothetical protein